MAVPVKALYIWYIWLCLDDLVTFFPLLVELIFVHHKHMQLFFLFALFAFVPHIRQLGCIFTQTGIFMCYCLTTAILNGLLCL